MTYFLIRTGVLASSNATVLGPNLNVLYPTVLDCAKQEVTSTWSSYGRRVSNFCTGASHKVPVLGICIACIASHTFKAGGCQTGSHHKKPVSMVCSSCQLP